MQAFLVNDYTMCTQSVYLVVLISLDQLLILRKGAHYFAQETRPKAYAKIASAWVLSFLVFGPAIIGWDHWAGGSVLEPGDCNVEFYRNKAYMIVTAVIEFIVPALVLTALNASVYWEIRKRTKVTVPGPRCVGIATLTGGESSKTEERGEPGKDTNRVFLDDVVEKSSKTSVVTLSSIDCARTAFSAAVDIELDTLTNNKYEHVLPETRDKIIHSDPLERHCVSQHLNPDTNIEFETIPEEDTPIKLPTSGRPSVELESTVNCDRPELKGTAVPGGQEESHVGVMTTSEKSDQTRPEKHFVNQPATSPASKQPCNTSLSETLDINRRHWRNLFRKRQKAPEDKNRKLAKAARKDVKAAKHLFIFVFVFVILWTPYTIATIVITFCEECVNPDIYEFFIWWLWFKSAVNPLLYAANSSRFKRNIVNILSRVCFCCKSAWKARAP